MEGNAGRRLDGRQKTKYLRGQERNVGQMKMTAEDMR